VDSCDYRAWTQLLRLDPMAPPGPSFDKHGELKKPTLFRAADPCGAPAIVSYTVDGQIVHRCARHRNVDTRYRDGNDPDPRSIGGSRKYRYQI